MKKLMFVTMGLLLATAMNSFAAEPVPSEDKNWEEMGKVTFDGSGYMYAGIDLKLRQAGHVSFRMPSYCNMEYAQVEILNDKSEKETLTPDTELTHDDGNYQFVTYKIDSAYANELKEVVFAMVSESDESGCDAHVFLTSDYVGVR